MKNTSSIGSEYQILEKYSHEQLAKLASKIFAYGKVSEDEVVILDLAAKKGAADEELLGNKNNHSTYNTYKKYEKAVTAFQNRDTELPKFLAQYKEEISAKSVPIVIQRILNALNLELSKGKQYNLKFKANFLTAL